MNKFKIVINAYNKELWIPYNLNSILNQTYKNFEIIYIDDASTDKTFEIATDILTKSDNVKYTLFQNEVNMRKPYSDYCLLEKVSDLQDDDILVLFESDDWFATNTVLEQLNDLYNATDCWVTYGGMVVWEGFNPDGSQILKQPYPQNTNFPDIVHKHRNYRKDLWRASHLKTMRGFIYKSINKEDFKTIDGKWTLPEDIVIMFAALEMSGKDKIQNVKFSTHIYNQHPSVSGATADYQDKHFMEQELEIRNRDKYKLYERNKI